MIISATNPKAKTAYKCHLCSEAIDKGEKYIYATVRTSKSLKGLKMHCKCAIVAKDLGINVTTTNGYGFKKAVVKASFNLLKNTSQKRSASALAKYSTYQLTDLIYLNLEAMNKAIEDNTDTMQRLTAVTVMMTTIVMLCDEYKDVTDNIDRNMLSVFDKIEKLSNEVLEKSSTAGGNPVKSMYGDEAINVYSEIAETANLGNPSVIIEVIVSMLDEVVSKYKGVSKFFNYRAEIKEVEAIKGKLQALNNANPAYFISSAVYKACAHEGITFKR